MDRRRRGGVRDDLGDGIVERFGGLVDGVVLGDLGWRRGVPGCGQDVVVGEGGEALAEAGGEAEDAGGEPGLRGDGDLSAAGLDGGEDAVGGVGGGGGDDRGFGAEVEPGFFLVALAGEVGVVFAAGTHEAGADGGDADAFVAQFGVQALGEAGERELGGDVGEQVRDGDLAADGGDVDDGAMGGLAGEGQGEQVWDGGVDGVEGGEEVGLHGAVVGVDGLVAEGADLDDAGVVDEDVEAAEGAEGLVDEAVALGGVGEVAGDEEDVVFVGDVAGVEEFVAGEFEFVGVACGEGEFEAGAAEAVGEREAEAAGSAGDDGDLAGDKAGREGGEGVDDCGGCGDGSGEGALVHGW